MTEETFYVVHGIQIGALIATGFWLGLIEILKALERREKRKGKTL